MNGLSTDAKFYLIIGFVCAIILGLLCIVAIIEAIDERRARAEERRRACKRYNTAIRPARRY
jgi:Tfp pilus assembly protein PilX